MPCEKHSLGDPLTEWTPELTGAPTPPRRRWLSPIEQQQLDRQVNEWAEKGIIEVVPKRLPWINNTVHVAKKNGTIRVCIDCTPANRVTKDFEWPLPKLQELRLHLGGTKWYTRIDLKDAFFRIGVPTRWRHLTAFQSGITQWQFKKMPFGLKTAPSTFQRYMDHILAPHSGYTICYIDDILVYGVTKKELNERQRRVMATLRTHKCNINKEKSEFTRPALLYAGIWIFNSGIGPNHEKVRELGAIPPPRTKEEIRSALGLVSYLRDFVPLTSLLTAKLTDKETDLTKEWERFIIHVASTITTLHHWTENEPAELYTDASLRGIGAVLIQTGRIVALASRKLTPAETRYSTTDREHLSLALAADKFKLMLHSKSKVEVFNDHLALLGRRTDKMLPRQARTYEHVTQWIPHLRHVKGAKNPADYLSRWNLEIFGGQIHV